MFIRKEKLLACSFWLLLLATEVTLTIHGNSLTGVQTLKLILYCLTHVILGVGLYVVAQAFRDGFVDYVDTLISVVVKVLVGIRVFEGFIFGTYSECLPLLSLLVGYVAYPIIETYARKIKYSRLCKFAQTISDDDKKFILANKKKLLGDDTAYNVDRVIVIRYNFRNAMMFEAINSQQPSIEECLSPKRKLEVRILKFEKEKRIAYEILLKKIHTFVNEKNHGKH